MPAYLFLFLIASLANGFIPGISPTVYKTNDNVDLFMNELTSIKTQIPYDFYSLPYCKVENVRKKSENLGEKLEGEVKESSGYKLKLNQQVFCSVICEKKLSKGNIEKFQKAISDNYSVQMSVDGLPVARAEEWVEGGSSMNYYSRGYPVGFIGKGNRYYLNNHIRLQVAINPTGEENSYNVVGFVVEPFSFDHQSNPELCEKGLNKETLDYSNLLTFENPKSVKFSYDVTWEETNMPWSQRWDIYMHGSGGDQIHWFSITNSSLIVLFLTALVAMIMLRALRSDIAKYNATDIEDSKDESGWKLVHGDVFRPPQKLSLLFPALIGTGIQLLVMIFLVLIFAMMGLVSPAQRGNLLTCTMLLFVLMGSFAGYHAAKIHKVFRGTSWVKVTILAAAFLPAICFTVFSIINIALSIVGSTAAVPFSALLTLILLWLLVQAPLVFLGSYWGFKKELPEQPVRTNQIPRQIPPQPWFLQPYVALPFGGILPFGAISVELYFIMTAVWMQQLYYIFSFLFLVMIILILTSAEISIVLCYFQLCAEDHRWWWKSVCWAGSCSGYMFLYSVWYYMQDLDMDGIVPTLLYFGYSGLISFCFALITGTVGFFSCYWFISKIYGSIKVD